TSRANSPKKAGTAPSPTSLPARRKTSRSRLRTAAAFPPRRAPRGATTPGPQPPRAKAPRRRATGTAPATKPRERGAEKGEKGERKRRKRRGHDGQDEEEGEEEGGLGRRRAGRAAADRQGEPAPLDARRRHRPRRVARRLRPHGPQRAAHVRRPVRLRVHRHRL